MMVDDDVDCDLIFEEDYYCENLEDSFASRRCGIVAPTLGDFVHESTQTESCFDYRERNTECNKFTMNCSVWDENSYSLCESSILTDAESFYLVDDVADNDNISFCDMNHSDWNECLSPQPDSMETLFDYPMKMTAAHYPTDSHVCPICLEHKSSAELVQLFKGCQHVSACKLCLHSHYVEHAMHDVNNFPLKCFWPSCTRYLRNVQLQGFVKHINEIEAFHRLEANAKQAKKMARKLENTEQKYELIQQRRIQNLQVLQHCHCCSYSTPVNPGRGATRFQCIHCKNMANIDVMTVEDVKAMIRAPLEQRIKEKERFVCAKTLGDLLVNCPLCSTLIYKDGGCFELHCEACQTKFDFKAAKVKMDRFFRNDTANSQQVVTGTNDCP
jgi:hypothetical protein